MMQVHEEQRMKNAELDSSSCMAHASCSTEGVHPIEAAAVAASPSLAALLTGHVLRDGELVLLILKPSLWWIVFKSLPFAAIVAILMIAARILDPRLPGHNLAYQEAGIFLLAGRVMWSVLQWMGRLYLLTNLRIVRLSGIFSVDIFDCPLRKVGRTRLVSAVRERLVGLGSIEIVPQDESSPTGLWQTIRHPVEVHEQIVATINRAKQGGRPCAGE